MIQIEGIKLYICLLQVIYSYFNILAVNITSNQNIAGLIGKNDTHLTCSFTIYINQNFINVAIITRNKDGLFQTEEPVAIFPADKAAMLLPSGDYLSGRVTLTNITKVSTTATLRFDNLECEDEKDYICTFSYINDLGVVIIDKSEPTRILVKAFPSMPDIISYIVIASIGIKKQDNSSGNLSNNRNNISLSTNRNSRLSFSTLLTDTVTLTSLRSTEKSVPSFREGDSVQFTCTGNIGKPQGRFVWEIIPQQGEPIVFSNETTEVVDQIRDICSFRGTSNLTFQMISDYFKAKVRCFEETQADVIGMFVETEPLDVLYTVRHINIINQPNQAQYDQKTPTITLTCKGDGNPEPTYKWFRQENTRSILSSSNLYIIEDVIQNNSGVYICEAYNTIDYIVYSAKYSVEIDIVEELWSSTESDSLKISAEYAALVIPVICVVVITMICFAVRKHHCKRGKGKISSLLDASVIYAEVNEHTKLKYRLKNNQATSLIHAKVEHALMEDILSASISINQNITGLVGKNDTHLTCTFIKDNNQDFINVAITARNKNGIFPKNEPVAVFLPDKGAILPLSGDYLSGRVTLTNITKISTSATLRFDNLECEDEKDYICTFIYVNDLGVVITDESEPTRILVKETEPLNVSYTVRHINITKRPNQAQYDQKTPTIILTCKGDGNPEPSYKWFRQENTHSILSSTNLYIIEDVVQNNSGVYICEVYNTIDDIEYNANYSVEIDIDIAQLKLQYHLLTTVSKKFLSNITNYMQHVKETFYLPLKKAQNCCQKLMNYILSCCDSNVRSTTHNTVPLTEFDCTLDVKKEKKSNCRSSGEDKNLVATVGINPKLEPTSDYIYADPCDTIQLGHVSDKTDPDIKYVYLFETTYHNHTDVFLVGLKYLIHLS
ncbi:CADM3 [Mytilus coruscus]|uniref:CADM3 n=1 Tax=Mytilus coruscus TaxID=42192 RepID=A0A6J8BQR3_MYTCO|nr:CADM3 [Mytilus coruscus]